MSCLSLRLIISALLVVGVIVVTSVTLAATLTTGLDALRALGERQTKGLAAAAVARVEALFAVPEATVNALQSTMQSPTLSGQWPSNDAATFDRWVAMARLIFRQCNPKLGVGPTKSVAFLFADNSQMNVAYMPNANQTHSWNEFSQGNYTYIVTINKRPSPIGSADPTTNLTAVQQQTQTVTSSLQYALNFSQPDPTRTEGLQTLLQASASSKVRDTQGPWQTVTSLSRSKPFAYGVLTAAWSNAIVAGVVLNVVPFLRPNRQSASEVFGYATTQIDISDLSNNLAATVDTYAPWSALAAVTSNGYMIASSLQDTIPCTRILTAALSYTSANETCLAPKLQTSVLGLSLTVSLCRSALNAYPFAPLGAVGSDWVTSASASGNFKSYDVGGDTYYAVAAQVTLLFPGTQIYVVVVTPERRVIGDVVASQQLAVGVSVGVLVVSCLCAFVVTRLLLRPLRRLADRMTKASEFADSGEAEALSHLREVEQLQEAYHAMNTELLRIRSFVPQSVLARYQARSRTLQGADVRSNASSRRLSNLGAEMDDDRESVDTATGDVVAAEEAGASEGSRRRGAPVQRSRVLRLAIRRKLVTVFSARLCGLHGSTHGYVAGTDVVLILAELAEAASRTTAACEGVVALYSGDSVMATFNAVKKCEAHATQGSIAACRLVKAMDAVRDDPTLSVRTWGLRVGVSTGMCMVGNVGSATAKNHSTMGGAVSEACFLETLSWRYGEGCRVLGSRRVVNEADSSVMHLYVDVVKGSASREGSRAMAVASLYDRASDGAVESVLRTQLPQRTASQTLLSVGSVQSAAGLPQWLYGAGAAASAAAEPSPEAKYFAMRSDVVEALCAGQSGRALRILSSYLRIDESPSHSQSQSTVMAAPIDLTVSAADSSTADDPLSQAHPLSRANSGSRDVDDAAMRVHHRVAPADDPLTSTSYPVLPTPLMSRVNSGSQNVTGAHLISPTSSHRDASSFHHHHSSMLHFGSGDLALMCKLVTLSPQYQLVDYVPDLVRAASAASTSNDPVTSDVCYDLST